MRRVGYVQVEARRIGGVETNLLTLLRFQRRERIRPHVIFLEEGELVDRIRAIPGLHTVVLRRGRMRNPVGVLRTLGRIVRYVRKHQIDILVSNNFQAFIYGGIAAKLARVKSVFWAHAIVDEGHLRDPIIWLAMRLSADLGLANSEATAEGLRRHWNGTRVTVLPCGLDTGFFSPRPRSNEVLETLGIPPGAFVVTMIGRIQPWKGQLVFVQAAEQVALGDPECYFLVVGAPTFPADFAYLETVKLAASRLLREGRIAFAGFRNDIPEIIASSDIIVHGSIAPEPFGIVVVEAMAMEKPVIATRGGGVREIVVDGETGLLTPPGDVQAMVRAILTLRKDSALRVNMGKEGRLRVEKLFSAKTMAERLEELLLSL